MSSFPLAFIFFQRGIPIPPTRSLLWLITINHQPGLHFPKFSPFFHLFKQRLHGGTIEVEETSFHPSSPCCEAVLVLLDFAYQLGGSVMTWKGDHERGLEPVKPSSNEKHGIFPVIYGLGTTYILFYNIYIYYTIIYNIWHIYIYIYIYICMYNYILSGMHIQAEKKRGMDPFFVHWFAVTIQVRLGLDHAMESTYGWNYRMYYGY